MEEREMDIVILAMPHDLLCLTGYQTSGHYWFQVLVVPLEKEPFMMARLLESSMCPIRTKSCCTTSMHSMTSPKATARTTSKTP
jgi:hypothetical protein